MTQTEEEKVMLQGGRNWSGAATNYSKPESPRAGRSKNRFSPEALKGLWPC